MDDILVAFIHTLIYNHTHVGMNCSLHVEIGDSTLYPRVHYKQWGVPLYVYYPPEDTVSEDGTWDADWDMEAYLTGVFLTDPRPRSEFPMLAPRAHVDVIDAAVRDELGGG